MSKALCKLITCAVVLGLSLSGPGAKASVCHYGNETLAINSNYWKKPCKNALRNKNNFLARVKNADLGQEKAWDYAIAFGAGKLGCAENDDFAFEIASVLVGWPIANDVQPWKLDFLSYHVPEYLDSDRKRAISWLHWIKIPSRYGALPRGWEKAEVRKQLTLDGYWEVARARFGDYSANPTQDRLLFEASIDPSSSRFDLDDAMIMMSMQENMSVERKAQIAELLVDPSIGHFDYDNAARLVAWYSPHSRRDVNPETISKVKSIWNQIAQNMMTSDDPAIRKRGQAILASGDPYQETPLELDEVELPKIPNLVHLRNWPNTLPKPSSKILNRMVRATDYPSRPMREERQGAVGLAALFGPDGNFSDILVLSSSGVEQLDKAARKTVLRRYRPKLKELKLTGFSGKSVLAPLPAIEWRIPREGFPTPGSKVYRNGRIIVFGLKMDKPVIYPPYGCPSPLPRWKN